MLKASQAGALLGLSARKVYALAESGALACHRFGSAVRFDPADIEAYKQSCRLPATTRAAGSTPAPKKDRPALDLTNPVLVRLFGLDRPRTPYEPPPELTPYQRSKQRKEEEQCRQENRRALVLFHANKRRAAKLNRTPSWADMDAIRAIYVEALRRTLETGVQHHVDHEIPLQGKLVSGLHVQNNLQILTGSENSKKRNRFEVEV